MRLGDICHTESGLILSRKRSRNDFETKHEYKVLSLNNIEDHGDFNEEELETFTSKEVLDKRYFTEEGDVLIRLSEPFTAVCIQSHQAGVLIPSYFIVLEITKNDYLPEYVSWYLNSSVVKRKYRREQTGSTIPNINQRIIQNLHIPNIPLEKQSHITKIHQLYLQERRLHKKLIKEKDRFHEAFSNKIITEQMEGY